MANSGDSPLTPTEYSVHQDPLANLQMVRSRMDSLQQFLSQSVNTNTVISSDQMAMVSSEIKSAIHQIILNGTALISPTSAANSFLPAGIPTSGPVSVISKPQTVLKVENTEENEGFESDSEVFELDAVELLAEHIHFCEICGKGFKRDANLRMHMRAHGNQFKTPEALAKPDKDERPTGKRKFSCPFEGCNRNKNHKKFRPLKSVICVKNHFKRSHCPKMYSCNRCNKKSFSVVSDLKSHLKHCGGVSKWKCSCGTTFSRKDKLFGHMALFEGHMPAIADSNEKNKTIVVTESERNEGEDVVMKGNEMGVKRSDNGLSEGFVDEFGTIDGYSLQDMLGSPSSLYAGGSFW